MNVLILVAVWSKVCIVLYCLKTVVIVLNGASELFDVSAVLWSYSYDQQDTTV
jgi:hypothetical protein